MENEVLKVEGMHCPHCKMKIEMGLDDLPGVTSVEVDLEAGTVDVTFDSSMVTLDAIRTVIEAEGFIVVA